MQNRRIIRRSIWPILRGYATEALGIFESGTKPKLIFGTEIYFRALLYHGLDTDVEKLRTGGNMINNLFLSLSTTAAILMCLTGCASMPEDPIEKEVFLEANDPLEPMNRAFFAFNTGFDKVILEPTAIVYRKFVPQPGRAAITRFLHNLKLPSTFINNLLQLEFGHATHTMTSFVINSTFGLGGIFDLVEGDNREEDLGQTFATWGLNEGFYLVIPFYGPSNLRDGLGLIGDNLLDPWSLRLNTDQTKILKANRTVIGAVNTRERLIEDVQNVRETSIDIYAVMRSLYRQKRGNDIRNGAPPPAPTFVFE